MVTGRKPSIRGRKKQTSRVAAGKRTSGKGSYIAFYKRFYHSPKGQAIYRRTHRIADVAKAAGAEWRRLRCGGKIQSYDCFDC